MATATYERGQKIEAFLPTHGDSIYDWVPAYYVGTLTEETVIRACGRPHLVSLSPEMWPSDQRKIGDEQIRPVSA